MEGIMTVLFSRADENRFVRAHAGLYKKAHSRTRLRAVRRHVRAYAHDILPNLIISRRDPAVLAAEEEHVD